MTYEHQFNRAFQYICEYFMSVMEKSELLIVMTVLHCTLGQGRDEAMLSFSWFREKTNLSQQGVSDGIQAALNRGLIGRRAQGNTFVYWFITQEREYKEQPLPRINNDPTTAPKKDQSGFSSQHQQPPIAAKPPSTEQPHPVSDKPDQQQKSPPRARKRSNEQARAVDNSSERKIHSVDNLPFVQIVDNSIVENLSTIEAAASQNLGNATAQETEISHLSTEIGDNVENLSCSVDTIEVSSYIYTPVPSRETLLRVLERASHEAKSCGEKPLYNIDILANKIERAGKDAADAVELWNACKRCGLGIGYFVKAVCGQADMPTPPPVREYVEEHPEDENKLTPTHDYVAQQFGYANAKEYLEAQRRGEPLRQDDSIFSWPDFWTEEQKREFLASR